MFRCGVTCWHIVFIIPPLSQKSELAKHSFAACFASLVPTYIVQQQRSKLAKPMVLDSFLGAETMKTTIGETPFRAPSNQRKQAPHCAETLFKIVSSCVLVGWALNGARNSKVLAQLCGTQSAGWIRIVWDGSTQLLKKDRLRKKNANSKLSQSWIQGSQTKWPSQACSLQPCFFVLVFWHTGFHTNPLRHIHHGKCQLC